MFIGVHGVGTPGVGQSKNKVHLLCGKGYGGRVDPNITRTVGPLTMRLNQSTCIAWIGLQMQHPIGMGIQDRIRLHMLITGQSND